MSRRAAALLALAVVVLVASLAGPAAARADSVRVYFLEGESFTPVTRDVAPGTDRLRGALTTLLRGPTAAEARRGLGTAIPDGSRLLGLRVDTPSGTVRVRLNRHFATADETPKSDAEDLGILGARLAQLVYTTTGVTGADRVAVTIPGFGTRVLTRDDFAAIAFTPATPPAAKGAAPTDVASVQAALVRLTYLPPEGATGSFDYRTQQAVLAFQSWEGLGRDGVVGPQTAARLQTAAIPAPTTPGATGRRLEIHRKQGVVLLISAGATVRAIHTSTGSGGNSTDLGTPPGSFRIYRKEVRSWSIPFKTWLPYAAYWDQGWALHGYPDVPAFPASHGCARLPLPEAKVVFDFVAIGTPVRVL